MGLCELIENLPGEFSKEIPDSLRKLWLMGRICVCREESGLGWSYLEINKLCLPPVNRKDRRTTRTRLTKHTEQNKTIWYWNLMKCVTITDFHRRILFWVSALVLSFSISGLTSSIAKRYNSDIEREHMTERERDRDQRGEQTGTERHRAIYTSALGWSGQLVWLVIIESSVMSPQ